MAIPHLRCQPLRRHAVERRTARGIRLERGRTAARVLAYRAAASISDSRDGGITADYSRKRGVNAVTVFADGVEIATEHGGRRSAEMTALLTTIAARAEKAERRQKAVFAREFVGALPTEASPMARQRIANGFSRFVSTRHHALVVLAGHNADRNGDWRNNHIHGVIFSRQVSIVDGQVRFGDKTRELDAAKTGSIELLAWRAEWERLINLEMDAIGAKRISMRSLEAQGVAREPQQHDGPARTAVRRKGERLLRQAWVDTGAAIEDVANPATYAAGWTRWAREAQRQQGERLLRENWIDTGAAIEDAANPAAYAAGWTRWAAEAAAASARAYTAYKAALAKAERELGDMIRPRTTPMASAPIAAAIPPVRPTAPVSEPTRASIPTPAAIPPVRPTTPVSEPTRASAPIAAAIPPVRPTAPVSEPTRASIPTPAAMPPVHAATPPKAPAWPFSLTNETRVLAACYTALYAHRPSLFGALAQRLAKAFGSAADVARLVRWIETAGAEPEKFVRATLGSAELAVARDRAQQILGRGNGPGGPGGQGRG